MSGTSAACASTTPPPASATAPASASLDPPPPPPSHSAAAMDTLTTAIYGLQRQMSQFASRLTDVEGRALALQGAPPPLFPPAVPNAGHGLWSAMAGSSSAGSQPPLHPPFPLGMPGFGGLPTAPPPTAAVLTTAVPPPAVPITQIPFPHSPSPLPPIHNQPSASHSAHEETEDSLAVPRYFKLTFPTFDGKEDPLGWLNRCDHFFRAQNTHERQKVGLASFHLTGVAQHWFYMLERDAGDINTISWPLFRSLCQQRFGSPLGANHLSDLARLPFRGSVAEYQELFQARLAPAGYLSPLQQVQLFTGGLPDQIRIDVELQAPMDLQRAMSLARAYERRSLTLHSPTPGRSSIFPPRTPVTSSPQLPATTTTPTPTLTPASPAPSRPFRRPTPTEMADCRRQGLCYNCDDPYVRGHKCPRLFYLEVTDFDEDSAVTDFDEDSAEIQSDTPQEEQPPLISLHAIAGLTTNDTMCVHVKIGEHNLIALLDSGSTSNFINQAVADDIGLHFHNSAGASVIVANGDRVQCQGLARDVATRIGVDFFALEWYAIPLDCFDMVLGIAFLKTLGPILWDFDELCMSFWHRGHKVFWRGIDSPQRALLPADRVPFPRVQRQPLRDRLNFISNNANDTPLLDEMLNSFADVFEPPISLPPQRPCDHRIHLLPDSQPAKVRPYRYPQMQKDELESQCATMLQQGIIRPSTSPFSAPVLLVKKHDGSWRFCVDYRALNKITVKDKFPIPIVEELIDELHGATFFTKLDLRAGYHQIRVHPNDIEKTAFRTHEGHFEFLVMPFGLTNAPSTFQALMNSVLKPFLRKCVLVFFDDILIYSSSWSEHLQHLRAVLTALRANNLHVKK
ncbi:uncharacterized protein LOC120682466 [Panicum virgatum]|uniref:uncharacterized protein LOC120682466 n=1 Tax=Panicum virgatum TaxID=38727 RepID=UPI0019D61551|nr:uncharacterized protein LOC120682466 [Panicum virgatum]